MPPHTDPGAWGVGDSASAAGGLIYLLLGLWRLPARRTFDGFVVLLATGISLVPLLMILIDPAVQRIAKFEGYPDPPRLLEIVISEARITLWWASCVAAAYLLKEFFAPTTDAG